MSFKLAVIPARGGSKRIPKKNLKDFYGRPIIANSILACLGSGIFDDVVVSTDDEEIAEISRSFGAKTPFMRPAELSDDYTPTVPVIKHAIETMQELRGQTAEVVCCLYAIAPFVTAQMLQEAHQLFQSEKPKGFVCAATEFSFPPQRGFTLSDGGMKIFEEGAYWKRSQDLEKVYHEAGTFWFGSPKAYLDELPFVSEISVPYMIPNYLVQDIDTLEDWARAELLFELLQGR